MIRCRQQATPKWPAVLFTEEATVPIHAPVYHAARVCLPCHLVPGGTSNLIVKSIGAGLLAFKGLAAVTQQKVAASITKGQTLGTILKVAGY